MWLRSFLGVLGAYHLIALPCVLALGPIIAERELDGASSWALIVTMFGIGSIIGAAIGLRAGPRRPMVACAVAFIGAACQPAIIAGAGQHAGDRGVRAAGRHLRRVRLHGVGDDTRAASPPPASLSRVTSFDWFTSVGLMPLGYALVGPVADAVGIDVAMFAATGVVASLAVASLLVRDIRSFEGGHPNLRTPASSM